MSRDIIAIDNVTMLATDETGFSFPITHQFDEDGDVTDGWTETAYICAGPDSAGKLRRLSIEIGTGKAH